MQAFVLTRFHQSGTCVGLVLFVAVSQVHTASDSQAAVISRQQKEGFFFSPLELSIKETTPINLISSNC